MPTALNSLLIPCSYAWGSRKPATHAGSRARAKKFPVNFPVIGEFLFLFVAHWVMARHPVRDSLKFAYPLFGRAQRIGLAKKFDAIHRCGIALQLAAARKDRLLQSSAAPLKGAQLIRPIAVPVNQNRHISARSLQLQRLRSSATGVGGKKGLRA